MKKLGLFSLFLCMVLLFQTLAVPALATTAEDETAAEPTAETTAPAYDQTAVINTDASIVDGCLTLDAMRPLRSEQLLKTADSALLYEVGSETMVFGWNLDVPMHPGGLTKLMTILIAVEQGNMDDMIEYTQEIEDSLAGWGTNYGLDVGEELSLMEMCYLMMMITSSNEAAVCVAEYIAGSEAAFVEMMNQRAKELGCTGTYFVNCHGVHDTQQVMTARDLAKIVNAGMQNEVFVELFNTEYYELPPSSVEMAEWEAAMATAPTEDTLPEGETTGDDEEDEGPEGPEVRQLFTSNYMRSRALHTAYYDKRVTGGKTSKDNNNRRHAVITAEKENSGLQYIAIVMGTDPIFEDEETQEQVEEFKEFDELYELLEIGYSNYVDTQVLYEGQITTQYAVTGGDSQVVVGPDRSVFALLPDDIDLRNITLRYQDSELNLTAPIEAGRKINILRVYLGSVCIGQANLIAINTVDVAPVNGAAGDSEGLVNTGGLMTGLIVFGVLVGIIVAAAAILYIIRSIRTAAYHDRSRRRRRSRRRSR